jgi:L-rhamnose-H+ transport protein
MANPILGVLPHWLGGLAAGGFYLPYKAVKKWSRETCWLVGELFSWIICPWIFAYFKTNNLLGVFKQPSASTLAWAYCFGAGWGSGGLTFGLAVRHIGLSLGVGVALGLGAALGTLLPPISKSFMPEISVPETIAQIASTNPGQVTLGGVAPCLIGIAVATPAGLTKEKAMPAEEKKRTLAQFSFVKGMRVATFAGSMSACTNKIWTGLPAFVVVLLGGLTTHSIWCAFLNIKHRSGCPYLASHVRAEHGVLETSDGVPGAQLGALMRIPNLPHSAKVQPLPLRHAPSSDVAFTVFLLHDGINANGRVSIPRLGAAHGLHHQLGHDVGVVFSRVERFEQKGSPANCHRYCNTHFVHDRRRPGHAAQKQNPRGTLNHEPPLKNNLDQVRTMNVDEGKRTV